MRHWVRRERALAGSERTGLEELEHTERDDCVKRLVPKPKSADITDDEWQFWMPCSTNGQGLDGQVHADHGNAER